MGMISEIHASHNAANLEKVLTAAILSKNPDVIKFVEAHIVPLYDDNVAESWGCYKISKKIVEAFPNYYKNNL